MLHPVLFEVPLDADCNIAEFHVYRKKDSRAYTIVFHNERNFFNRWIDRAYGWVRAFRFGRGRMDLETFELLNNGSLRFSNVFSRNGQDWWDTTHHTAVFPSDSVRKSDAGNPMVYLNTSNNMMSNTPNLGTNCYRQFNPENACLKCCNIVTGDGECSREVLEERFRIPFHVFLAREVCKAMTCAIYIVRRTLAKPAATWTLR